MFEENVDSKGMMASGYLEDLRNSARSKFKLIFNFKNKKSCHLFIFLYPGKHKRIYASS